MLVSGVCGTCEWDLHGMRMLGWLLDGDVVRLMVIIVDGGGSIEAWGGTGLKGNKKEIDISGPPASKTNV